MVKRRLSGTTSPLLPEMASNCNTVKWCEVSLSDVIVRGKRLDASVFDVEAKRARTIVERSKYPKVKVCGENGLTNSYVLSRFKRIWVEKSDIPIFQPSSIVDIKPIPDGYISHRTQTNIEALRVHQGQILMTCSGTIGKVAYVSKTLDGQVFSHDLLRINCTEKDVAGYVYAYLKSDVGNKILLTNSYGAVITHIEPEHLKTVPIPNAPDSLKHKINDLIVRSYELRDESNDLIDRATALLVEELHLPEIHDFITPLYKKNAEVDTFIVKLSNLACRIDASFHVPVANAIIKHMKKNAGEVTTVGDSRISKEVILPPRFARVYVDEGHGSVLIGGKQIFELDPSGKKYISNSKYKEILHVLQVEQNSILITRSGTIGKTVIVPRHWNSWIPSDDIIRIVPINNEIAGFLFVFLQSDYGHTLIERLTYGSVISHIDDNHVRSVPVPLLKDPKIQKQINDIALEANDKRYQAYKLEQEALEIMNREVIFAK